MWFTASSMAISNICEHLDTAIEYCKFVASPACQAGIYTITGGQPGHRQAWLHDDLNVLTNGFFEDTLLTHDEAYLRPRYPAYNRFQEDAGSMIWDFIREAGDSASTIDRLNKRYSASLTDA